MDDPTDDFLDRTEAVNNFRSLINDQRRRLLLIYGRAGRGKSSLQRELRRISRDEQTASAVVDFLLAEMVTEPNDVITYLSERLGDRFTAQMLEAEEDAGRQPVLDSAAIGEAISEALSDIPQRQGNGVSLSNIEKVQVGGNIVGGNLIIVKNPNFFLDPDRGRGSDQAMAEKQQSDRFLKSLKNFLAEQKRVILFFDHFEKATTPISNWLSHDLLDLILAETEGYSNLWIIFAGRHVPLQDQADNLQHILVTEEIDSLPDDVIYLVWNENRGVDKVIVDAFIKGADGDTGALFRNLRNYARKMRSGSSDGK
jgi:hypothetical protein